jgi:hypothetical protein
MVDMRPSCEVGLSVLQPPHPPVFSIWCPLVNPSPSSKITPTASPNTTSTSPSARTSAPPTAPSPPPASAGATPASRSSSTTGRPAPADTHRFTTIASWRGPFGPVTFAGRTYGPKVHEFRKVFPWPRLVREPAAFEIALDVHPGDNKDLTALRENGWLVTDSRALAGDPAAFRHYVQQSAAEFSVAQGIYVDTNSGWFSDRSVRYLASGRPVLVQDTGLAPLYPVGKGLLTFRTLDEAAAGAEAIRRDYDHHCRAARALAEAHFDSDKVLSRFLDEVGLAP